MVERNNGFFETSFLPGRAFRLAGGLQRPARRLADHRANTRTVRSIQRPAGGPAGDRPPGDDAAAAGRPAGRADPADPARPRLLRARGHQRLLRRPAGDRPVRRRHRLTAPRSRRSATASSSPATTAAGPSTAWSPTRPTSPPPTRCAWHWPSNAAPSDRPSRAGPPAQRRPRRRDARPAGLRRPVRRRLHPTPTTPTDPTAAAAAEASNP